jgi:hypothetical protein
MNLRSCNYHYCNIAYVNRTVNNDEIITVLMFNEN